MSIQKNDPRITAYALGELSAQEKENFEKELNNNQEIINEIEEIQKISSNLKDELVSEGMPQLSSKHKEVIMNEINLKEKRKSFLTKYRFQLAGVCACLLVVVLASKILLLPKISTVTNKVFQKADQSLDGTTLGYNTKSLPSVAPRSISKGIKRHKYGGKKYNFGYKGKSMTKSARSFELSEFKKGYRSRRPIQIDRESDYYHQPTHQTNTESYDEIQENPFLTVTDKPLSTFSVDVDTASYSNARRFLNQGSLPPRDAIRIEEFINYFDYKYENPTGEHPFSVNLEQSASPWNKKYQLVRIGIKGHEMAINERPATNLVFLLDVSGSMNSANKLGLLKQAFSLLVKKLGENDRVAIVVYAGSSGVVLPATKATEKATILQALHKLQAGGSTNGGQGIELAYKIAKENFIKGGVNRVILATDGDFNVGVSSREALIKLIEDKARSGIFLTVMGFGMGNYKDGTMEKLADKGNGNYAYIDTYNEAKKVLVNDLSGTLVTIAKDVKIQVEFNPSNVEAYRLVGYENRKLKDRDFNDDTKDAGEIGAGHKVTAIYEIVPKGEKIDQVEIDNLKYQQPKKPVKKAKEVKTNKVFSNEMLTVKLRYKKPMGDKSTLISVPLQKKTQKFENTSKDFKLAVAAASFAYYLRGSKFTGTISADDILKMAKESKGDDKHGYREEFIELIDLAKSIKN